MENDIKVVKWAADKYASLSYSKNANPIDYERQFLPFEDGFIAGLEYVKFREWQCQVYSFRPNWKSYIKIGHAVNHMTITRKTYTLTDKPLIIDESELKWFGGLVADLDYKKSRNVSSMTKEFLKRHVRDNLTF